MVGKSIKKIGIVLGQEEKEETADRYKGFEDAIKDSGMKWLQAMTNAGYKFYPKQGIV